MKLIQTAILIGTVLLGSCKGGWTEEQRKQYIDDCMKREMVNERTEAVDRAFCSCMQEKLEKEFPEPGDTVKLSYQERISWSAKCLGHQ